MAIEAVPQTNYSQTLILGCLDLRPHPKTNATMYREQARAPYINTQNAYRVSVPTKVLIV